jgi:hypothetical protein
MKLTTKKRARHWGRPNVTKREGSGFLCRFRAEYLNQQMGRRRKMTSPIVKAMCFLSVAQELLGAENFSAAFQDLARQAVSKALSHLGEEPKDDDLSKQP